MGILQAHTYQYVTEKLREKDVFKDPDIQRPLDNWDLEMQRDAIRSYCYHRLSAPLVLADIRACLEWTMNKDPFNEYSIDYYQGLLNKNFKYVILDGNHKRHDVLLAFFDNKWTYTGKLINHERCEQEFVNVFYKDLPESYQVHLMNCWVSVMIHDDLVAQELSGTFIDLQKGTPLNSQQKRRPLRTPLTRWSRELSQNNAALWERLKFGKGEGLAYCSDEEMIAKFLVATVTEWGPPMQNSKPDTFNLKSKDLDNLYISGIGFINMFDKESPYIQNQFDRFSDIFTKFTTFISLVDKSKFTNNKGNIVNSTKLQKSAAWMLWWAVEYVHDNKLTVGDYNKFYDQVLKNVKKLKARSHKDYGTDAANASEDEIVVESQYFHRCLELPHQSFQRKQAKKEFIKDFSTSKNLKSATITTSTQSLANTA